MTLSLWMWHLKKNTQQSWLCDTLLTPHNHGCSLRGGGTWRRGSELSFKKSLHVSELNGINCLCERAGNRWSIDAVDSVKIESGKNESYRSRKLKSQIKRIKEEHGFEVKSDWVAEMCRHTMYETKRMKERWTEREGEEIEGVRWCSLWLSHSLAVLLCHRQRLCTHNSVWFRAAIERSGIISSIICRKVWADWISRIQVFAAHLGCSFSFSRFKVNSVQLHSSLSSSFHFLMNI